MTTLGVIIVLARLAMGGAFVVAGVRNALGFRMLAPMMAGMGVPMAPVALAVGIAVQVGCGLALALGILVPWAAAGLALFVVVATAIFHRFWKFQGPERVAHINGVISNVALVGAFVFVAAASL